MNTEEKRAHEARIMEQMIAIYCRGKGHAGRTSAARGITALCSDCRRLLDYALSRVEGCPRMDMRAQVRDVMRYSGPRMLLHHPLTTLRHMWIDFNARRREKKGVPHA
ncbi:MAG: nitrous oxide-stimulated promoter family protein [Selenomonas artemidis]|nr:nitrous oxide-stimulated promoter family protein [Selenomonas artemidis]